MNNIIILQLYSAKTYIFVRQDGFLGLGVEQPRPEDRPEGVGHPLGHLREQGFIVPLI